MVRVAHSEAQVRGISDEAIYTSQTRDLFLFIGSSLALFVIGFGAETYWLLRRLRTGVKSRVPEIIFVLAIIPFVFSTGRVLLNLYKMGKPF